MIRAQIKSTDKRIEALSNRLIFSAPATDRSPWIVQVNGSRIEMAPASAPNDVSVYEEVNAFFRAVDRMSPDQSYFVVVVRAAGIEWYRRIWGSLKQRGFELGRRRHRQ